MSLLFNMLSRLVITFLPKSKCLLISGLHHRLQWFSMFLLLCVWFRDWLKRFPATSLMLSQWGGKKPKPWKTVFSTWDKHSTISSDQGTHFSGQIIWTLVKTLQKFWSHHSMCCPQSSGKVKTTNGILQLKTSKLGTSLLVRWLSFCVSGQKIRVWSLVRELNPLAWRILGTGEPGRLPSMGLHRVRHDWSDLAAAAGN